LTTELTGAPPGTPPRKKIDRPLPIPAKVGVRKLTLVVIPGRGRSPWARHPETPAYEMAVRAGVHGFRAWPFGSSRN